MVGLPGCLGIGILATCNLLNDIYGNDIYRRRIAIVAYIWQSWIVV